LSHFEACVRVALLQRLLGEVGSFLLGPLSARCRSLAVGRTQVPNETRQLQAFVLPLQ